jgi:hypothetical protein
MEPATRDTILVAHLKVDAVVNPICSQRTRAGVENDADRRPTVLFREAEGLLQLQPNVRRRIVLRVRRVHPLRHHDEL